jgi:8-oxo-dGTP pyrophosphatase MutT (NUDIX family)
MPSVSEAQHRAMEAAAHGHSTLGIPKKVGEEFVRADDAKMAGAGVAFVAPDGRVLFLKRGEGGDHAGEWALPGGGIEAGETARQAARREAREETGFADAFDADFDIGWLPVNRATTEDVDFTTFLHPVGAAFEPTLNDESAAHAWAKPGDAPEPLHPGVKAVIDTLAKGPPMASDSLAFDRASVRSIDRDGHLFVEITPISKANVCPYRGSEIPGCDDLGLEPDRIYRLLRDPDELKKGADTFKGKPLMLIHKPVSADDHPRNVVVGSVGTDVSFDPPYLMAPLSVWDAEAIALIDSGEQKELSSSYHYRADMTAGKTPDGEAYDGVMRDIVGNHVALVKEGRAGPDVVVGDSKEELNMSKNAAMTLKAAVAHGALTVFLKPKLAADAKIDLGPILAGVTAKNFKEKRPAIVTALKTATKGKLAADASIEDVAKVLEVLDDVKPAAEDEDDTPAAGASGARGRVSEFLKGKISEDDMKACDALFDEDEQEAMDGADEEDKDKGKEKEKPASDADGDNDEPKVTKKAMDAAIGSAVKAATDQLRKAQRDVREAEELVRPYVGKLAVACDSADEIYKTALTGMGVNIAGVHPSAYKALLTALPVPNAAAPKQAAPAMDAAGVSSFHEMFPDAKTHVVGAL